jgi:uncharacterized integral membrane protein
MEERSTNIFLRPRVILVILLAIVVFVLILQNTHVVELNLLLWTVSMSLVVLIVVTTFLGFVGGYLVARILGRPRGGADV